MLPKRSDDDVAWGRRISAVRRAIGLGSTRRQGIVERIGWAEVAAKGNVPNWDEIEIHDKRLRESMSFQAVRLAAVVSEVVVKECAVNLTGWQVKGDRAEGDEGGEGAQDGTGRTFVGWLEKRSRS